MHRRQVAYVLLVEAAEESDRRSLTLREVVQRLEEELVELAVQQRRIGEGVTQHEPIAAEPGPAGHPAESRAEPGQTPRRQEQLEPPAQAMGLLGVDQAHAPDRTYRVLDLNHGALGLLGAILGLDAPDGPNASGEVAALGLNLARLTFDPNGAEPCLANFDEVGRQLLWRIQREALDDPDDGEIQDLLAELLTMPTVDPDWRHVDLQVPSDPALVLHLRGNGLDLRFLTMITAFQAPQNVAVHHLRIETWFPYDDASAEACRELGEAVCAQSGASATGS